MQPREKKLAIAIGILVGIWGIKLIFDSVIASYKYRTNQIVRLDQEITAKRTIINQAAKDQQLYRRWQEQSLPTDSQKATYLYRNWLVNTITNSEIQYEKIVPIKTKSGKYFKKISYQVNCSGTLPQLVKMLYQFYKADYLHRIRKLSITPVTKSDILTVRMTVDALILKDGKQKDKLETQISNRLKHGDVNQYLQLIVERNLFGLPNALPTLAKVGKQKIALGQQLSLSLKATDKDKKDKLSYRIEKGAPLTAEISSSGRFRWTPMKKEDLGKHQVTFIVKDSGLPPKMVRETIEIEVSRAKFELANIAKKSAYLNQPLKFNARLASTDPLAQLKFSLGKDAPEGATIDQKGNFQWTATSQHVDQKFSATILAKDLSANGRTSKQTFEIAVQIPKPKSEKLNTIAKFTVLSAILENGHYVAWFISKTTGKKQVLKKGDTLKAGNFTGKLIEILPRSVLLKTGNTIIELQLGESLDHATPNVDGGL